MAALSLATQVEIPRPDTTTGWLFLVFGVVLLAFLVNEGVYQLVRKTYPELKKTLFFFFVLLIIGVLAANEAGWGQDPVGTIDLLPADQSVSTDPLGGVETKND